MAEINLTQAEADALIAMEKQRANDVRVNFPMQGESVVLPLQSLDKREQFLLDGEEVPVPHLHLYREGYGDKWALPVPTNEFRAIGDVWKTLEDFMRYCNITQPPHIERGLFT